VQDLQGVTYGSDHLDEGDNEVECNPEPEQERETVSCELPSPAQRAMHRSQLTSHNFTLKPHRGTAEWFKR
jgi:hypothetical protein